MLAIEVDGSSHDNKETYDKARQETLEALGIRFIRFRNEEVLTDLQGCITILKNWIENNMKQ